MASVKHVYLDITDTHYSGFNTGIQRVARNLALRSARIGQGLGVPCTPVVWCGNRFVDARRLLRRRSHRRAPRLDAALLALAATVQRLLDRKVSRRSPVYRLPRAIWRSLRKPLLERLALSRLSPEHRQPVVAIGPDDVLVVADAYWGHWGRAAAQAAKAQARQGTRLILLVYDLFPLTHPEWFEPDQVALFRRAFTPLARATIGLAAISAAIAADVQRYLLAHDATLAQKPLTVFRLGSDFSSPAAGAKQPVRQAIEHLARQHRHYLCVGTLEPRKGYRSILDAMDLLAADSTFTLCIVGRVGWKCDDLMDRIRAHPLLGHRLFHFTDANDTELRRLYDTCRALIVASEDEGFGLPLVEAMDHRVPVVANDLPVFRETGGDYPLYYTGRGPGLARAVLDLEERLTAGWRPMPPPRLTWDASAAQFADALRTVLEQHEAKALDAARLLAD